MRSNDQLVFAHDDSHGIIPSGTGENQLIWPKSTGRSTNVLEKGPITGLVLSHRRLRLGTVSLHSAHKVAIWIPAASRHNLKMRPCGFGHETFSTTTATRTDAIRETSTE